MRKGQKADKSSKVGIFEIFQAVLAAAAFMCALATTGASICRHDRPVGIITHAVITALMAALLYMSLQEARPRKEEGGTDEQH